MRTNKKRTISRKRRNVSEMKSIRRHRSLRESNELTTNDIIDLCDKADIDDEYVIAAFDCLANDYSNEFPESRIRNAIRNQEYSINTYYGNTEVTVDDATFRVFDDEDTAFNAAVESVIDLIDEVGIEALGVGLTYSDWISEDGEDRIKEYMMDSMRHYCLDIADEDSDEYESRLVEECYEKGVIDDADFEELLNGEPDYMSCKLDSYDLAYRYCNDYESSIYDWSEEYAGQFGEESLKSFAEYHNIFDSDRLGKYLINTYGIGNELSGYDSAEHTSEINGTTYYLYRI